MKLATLCYVIDKKINATLMLHRVKKGNDVHEGKWNGLGGKFEKGESPEECVIREVKEESGFKVIIDGTNFDDMSDYRPGYKASKNQKIKSPLVDLKFSKNEIREISKSLGLEIWNKPSSPCLSSRIPYGQKVTLVKLTLIEQAEEILQDMGFNEYRVRHFEFPGNENTNKMLKLAKIDFHEKDLHKALNENMVKEINSKIKELGYDFVTIDLAGLKSGSLNVMYKKKS